ncbi:MAG: ABC transporter permease subunit [Acidimicrobiia bacterium]|jgi:arabinogalactan oligomer/maltooligosaccharide transport system permease protein
MTDREPTGGLDEARAKTTGSPSGEKRGETASPRFSFTWGVVLKFLFLAAVNALFLAGLPMMIDNKWWAGLVVTAIATALIDWAYLGPRNLPGKYLVPGTVFALAFQVVPVVYSGYISMTNSSIAHRLSQDQAIDNLTSRTSNVPGTTRFEMTILGDEAGTLAFYLVDEDATEYLGTEEGLDTLTPDRVTTDADGDVTGVDDYTALQIGEVSDRQDEILSLEVPSEQGTVKAATIGSAAVYEPLYSYDDTTGILVDNATGVVYEPVDGFFTSADGDTLDPGWQVFIGFDNYARAFAKESIRGPFLRVLIWNYVFAIASVALTFVVGLGLAIALNHPGMRGQKLYRAFLIIPYALPSFMTALLWAGMLNQEFGVINRILGADIPWLRDPTMAKLSILLVNTWLGFPYMFLVSTGALQAIPESLKEASYVDGATPRQAFRSITFPLLMIALAPLLIASFAFNFNNFNIIYLLNQGGPPIEGAATPAGHTDILISYTYRLAFESGQGAQWGFASAIAVLIFLMVAAVSAISFRRTRALEDVV